MADELRMGRSPYLAMLGHCLRESPKEACGLFVLERRPSGLLFLAVVPSINCAEDAVHEFCVDPDLQREYSMRNDTAILGTYHSHPRTGPVPSELDKGMYLGMRKAFEGDIEQLHAIVSLKSGQPVVRAWKAHPTGIMQIAFEVI